MALDDDDDEVEDEEPVESVPAAPVQLDAAPAQSEPVGEPEGPAPAEAAAAEPEPEAVPAPRRRTRTRKAAEEAPPATEPGVAEEPTPKRRTRSRKAAEEAPAPEPSPAAAETKPKRTRRSRSGAATAGEAEVALPAPPNPDDEVDAALALDDEPAIDVPFPPGNAPATPEDARREAEQLFEPAAQQDLAPQPESAGAQSEPVATDTQAEPEPDRPRRRGWWSR
jgi:ribonuclease E